ncbi:MAG TPA: caspase family protein [Thermodesulfobacteriota bacterium]|nr:caspase family protein [Thermodesulfobacteriota bacterium]
MKHHILAIGISKHQNAAANLSYAAKDASEFFELFNLNIGDIGYKKLLIDSEATLGQIRAALGLELQQAIARGDAFFFFYSGHGVIANDLHDEASGSHYLVPFDGTFDYVNTCIPVSYLKESFNKLKSGANLVFIDSCFSGAASKNSKGYPGPRKKEFKGLKTISNTLSGVGNLTITASKDDEEAIEDSEFKNGLFTYYLLKELDRDKGTQNFPVLDIFTPICEQVIKRAKEKYNHTQTPTLNGQLEGTITLPTFRKPVRISPQIIQVSHSPELLEAAFPSIILEIDDKTQEKLLNDLIDLVARGRDQQTTSAALISFERICYKSLKALRTDWERIFVENGDDISKIPGSAAKLEGTASQLLMIGAVVSVFGSETQMKIYSEAVVDIWQFTQGRSGLVALITVPEIILAEIVYVIGIISMARENLRPWQILLQTPIYNLHGRDTPPDTYSTVPGHLLL